MYNLKKKKQYQIIKTKHSLEKLLPCILYKLLFKAIHTYSSIKRLMEKLSMIHARMSHPCNLMSPIILTKWLVSACGLLQISNEIWEKKKRYLVSMQNPSILKTINRVDYTAMYEQVQCGFKPQVILELISNNNLFSYSS